SGRGVPGERRVRDDQGGGGERLARRGAHRRRDADRHPAPGGGRHHHVLREGRRTRGLSAMRRHPLVAVVLSVALAVAPVAGQSGNTERELGRRFLLESRSRLPLSDDPTVTSYIEGLGNRVVKTLGPQEF